jgi:hypothetical protein
MNFRQTEIWHCTRPLSVARPSLAVPNGTEITL